MASACMMQAILPASPGADKIVCVTPASDFASEFFLQLTK
jgi:hypothetical protein